MRDNYSLLQKPIEFEKHNVKGKLFAIGNTKSNLIQFQVFFNTKEDVIPLLLKILDSKGMEHNVFLMLRDENNFLVKSHLYEPDFLIRKGLVIKDVRPVVCMS